MNAYRYPKRLSHLLPRSGRGTPSDCRSSADGILNLKNPKQKQLTQAPFLRALLCELKRLGDLVHSSIIIVVI